MASWSLRFTLVPLCSDFLSRSKPSFQISFFKFCYLLLYEWKITLEKKTRKFLQTMSDSKSTRATGPFSSNSFISPHEENRKNRPSDFLLLSSNWTRMKLIFFSTSNSFWGLKCHTRETGPGEKGVLLCFWRETSEK